MNSIFNRITDEVLQTYLENIEQSMGIGFSYRDSKDLAMDAIRHQYNINGELTGSEISRFGQLMSVHKARLLKRPAKRVSRNKPLVTSQDTAIVMTCIKCGKVRPITEFPLRSDDKNRFQLWCTQCRHEVLEQIKLGKRPDLRVKLTKSPEIKQETGICSVCKEEVSSYLSFEDHLRFECKKRENKTSGSQPETKVEPIIDKGIVIKNISMTLTHNNAQVKVINNKFLYKVSRTPFTDAEFDDLLALRTLAKSKVEM